MSQSRINRKRKATERRRINFEKMQKEGAQYPFEFIEPYGGDIGKIWGMYRCIRKQIKDHRLEKTSTSRVDRVDMDWENLPFILRWRTEKRRIFILYVRDGSHEKILINKGDQRRFVLHVAGGKVELTVADNQQDQSLYTVSHATTIQFLPENRGQQSVKMLLLGAHTYVMVEILNNEEKD